MTTVILCGGQGLRLNDSLTFIPKGMVKIGHRPILWHVMKIYSQYGHNDFILALGKGGYLIRDYFLNYNKNINDITLMLGESQIEYKTQHQETDWKITFVETGEEAGTGARIFRCKQYVESKKFMVTYSDCLVDININDLLKYHDKSDKIATVTGVMPPYRYGEFIMKDNQPIDYKASSRLKSPHGWVNGGFMVFKQKIFEYLNSFNECILENEVFNELVKNREISIYPHNDFWQCLDNNREYLYLNELCDRNLEYWLFKSKFSHDKKNI